MGHLRKIRTVLAFSALVALASVGLPVAPTVAAARPADLRARHQLGAESLLQNTEDAARGRAGSSPSLRRARPSNP